MRRSTPKVLATSIALLALVACSSGDDAGSSVVAEAADPVPASPDDPAGDGDPAPDAEAPADESIESAPEDPDEAPAGSPTTEPVAEMPTTPLRFSMPPGVDDPQLILLVDDVADLIAEAIDREVVTENPADYMAVVEAIRGGFTDLAFMSQFVTALAIQTGAVSPLVVWEAEQLPAAFCMVRADSPIQTIDDVRGAEVAFVDPGSTTGHFMPRSLFAQYGLEYGVDYESRFAGGHDTAILAMLNESVDVACTARQLYTIFLDAEFFTEDEVRIIGETAPIPVGMSIVVRTDMDDATRRALAESVPDAIMADGALIDLVGGATDYIVNPDPDVYAPLLQVAIDVGLNIEDLR
ncbi:MAG: phosphate/phosphite/phosphonate ABC transporter substrate-binding protein [Ilumatobacter sp.]|nr:MAG: phosphate/phosphite/phosphonate ABC transporter substrate-binding protein [Ilumatobacter sp.]